MTVGELIKKLREEKDFSQRQLALYSEVSNTEISKIESGERQNPNPDILKKIADALNINYIELYKAAGYIETLTKPLVFNDPSSEYRTSNATPAEMVMLPVLGDIRAGKPLFADEHLKGQMPFPKEMLSAGYDHFLLKIDGDSMTGDGIEAGDIVLIRVQNYIDYKNQIAAVIINGYEACLKHVIYPEGSDMVILRSSNPSYQDIVHPADDVVINGVYAGIFKAPKK